MRRILLPCAVVLSALAAVRGGVPVARAAGPLTVPIVFVSRQIPANGSIYWSVPKDLPGVGAHSRFRVAAPGQLVVREADGTLRVLVDGAHPGAASLNLVDVNAPAVSWDGSEIAFAGLPAGSYASGPVNNPGAWRIYLIRADGANLRQLTFAEAARDLSQFGAAAGGLAAYDDTDPCWLPDGRIVFSSTRWPSYGHYSGVRTSNLHVVNADGSGLHRITSERNGADRPLVDPLTGRIVFSRWWRNHRFAIDSLATVADPAGGYKQHLGLSADRGRQVGGPDYLWRNAWQAAAINPDGTGLALFAGAFRDEEANHVYGGGFTDAGVLLASYFPMYNMTEAAGFGGIRRFQRGPQRYQPVAGVTTLTLDYVNPASPTSYGIFNGTYYAEPEALPDGRILVSRAAGVDQDYGLYAIEANGTSPTLVYDRAGTTELRARVLASRVVPPIVAETVTDNPPPLPPDADGPYDTAGTFVFDALNVYFNAPVDVDIVSAPPIGSAATMRFFLDHQRTSPGSFPARDWPILLGERRVTADGSVREPFAPADVPLFEQIRSVARTVPLTGGPYRDGAAHVTGMNYGRAGAVARCVGCHAGHTLIPIPADPRFTNLAPGAQVTVSSTRDPNYTGGLVDRRVLKGENWRYWTSAAGQAQGQWAQLAFPVPVRVRRVVLYNPRPGGEASSSVQVDHVTIELLGDPAGRKRLPLAAGGPLAVAGTAFNFRDVRAWGVRVRIDAVHGTFYGAAVASLAEIEVIGRGDTPSAILQRPDPELPVAFSERRRPAGLPSRR